MLIQNKKRIMYYMHYDIGNIIDEHIIYQLKAYYELGIEIVFISNSALADMELDKVRPICRKVMLHHNRGFDFTAWRDAILAEGWDFFYDYDQLIISNSSCYGPIFPFEEMFNEMDRREPDWWGVAERTAYLGFDNYVISSFAAFSRRVFTSELFHKFWESVHNEYRTFWDVIRHGELRLTQTLNKNFKYDVYAHLDDIRAVEALGHTESFFTANAAYFCEKTKSPFLKIKAFANTQANVYSKANDIFDMLKRINSQYPSELIINHQFRTSPLSWMRNFPDMLQVMDEVEGFSVVDLNIFVVLKNEKFLDFYCRCFQKSPFKLHIAVIEEINSKYNLVNLFGTNANIKIIPDSLREASWGKILKELFEELLENDKILLINDFRKITKYSDFLNYAIQNHIEKSLLGSSNRMADITLRLQNTADTAMFITPLTAEQILCGLAPILNPKDISLLHNLPAGHKIAMESSVPTCMTYCCYIKSTAVKLLTQYNFFDSDNDDTQINNTCERLIAYVLQKFELKTRFVTSTEELFSENAHFRDRIVSKRVFGFKKHFSASIELAGKACVNFYHSVFPASFTHKMMYFEEPVKQFLKKLLRK